MSEPINRQIRLASRPEGWVTPENFTMTEEPVAEPAQGEVLVRNLFMSVDPYMRGRMNAGKSYVAPFEIGEVLIAGVVGRVVASRSEAIEEGELVTGALGWENYSIAAADSLRKIKDIGVPLSWYLGILGMPGMTAWVGLREIAQVQEGESVFVSAASGAVGSVAGQIARNLGCHVAGCAGSDEKVDLLTSEFGYHAGFNYKTSDSLMGSIAEVCPNGIDVNFENVGGPIFEAALWSMNPFGRIALCGMISNYNDAKLEPGPRGMMTVIGKRLTIRGFIVSDHEEASAEFAAKASEWLAAGKLHYRETVAEGIENAPTAFIDMLKGGNVGKQVVRLADD